MTNEVDQKNYQRKGELRSALLTIKNIIPSVSDMLKTEHDICGGTTRLTSAFTDIIGRLGDSSTILRERLAFLIKKEKENDQTK